MKRVIGLSVAWALAASAFAALFMGETVKAWPYYLDQHDPAFAKPNFLDVYPQAAGTRLAETARCSLCHSGSDLVNSANPYRAGWVANGKDFVANSFEDADSDGDGFTNGQEIAALTFPGDPNDRPATGPIRSLARVLASEAETVPADNAALVETSLVGAPSALGETITLDEDTTAAITLNGLDPEGQPVAFAVLSSPQQGTLSGSAPNLTYVPNANYNGLDRFTFAANDGTFTSRTATVTLDVRPVNDPPVAAADQATTSGSSVTIALLANDSDPDGDALTVVKVFPARGGSVTLSANGTITYKPLRGFSGTDRFTYQVADGKGATATGGVTVIVR
jgi:hypothetical protein